MKRILLFFAFFLFLGIFAKAQYLDGNVSFGTNVPYLIEQLQGSIYDYGVPFQGSASLSFAQSDSTLGVVLLVKNQNFERIQRLPTGNNQIDISSTSFNIGIEKLDRSQDVCFGYRGLIGVSSWDEPGFFVNGNYKQLDITLNGLVSFKIANRIRFELQPGIVWMDLAGTFRDPNEWQFGREDISPFLDFSLRYSFWK